MFGTVTIERNEQRDVNTVGPFLVIWIRIKCIALQIHHQTPVRSIDYQDPLQSRTSYESVSKNSVSKGEYRLRKMTTQRVSIVRRKKCSLKILHATSINEAHK